MVYVAKIYALYDFGSSNGKFNLTDISYVFVVPGF